jgi:isopentenyl-diphosphate delta-isomerase type 1
MEEYLDVLDENGQQTGETKMRSLVHQEGDWHATAHIWILNSAGKLLMQKRSANKISHPNDWDISSAGHISAGDDEYTTAMKEVREELGIELTKDDLKLLYVYKSQVVLNGGTFYNNSFNYVFLVKKDFNIDTLTLQKEELSEVKWVTLKELAKIAKEKTPGYVAHTEEYTMLIDYLIASENV